MGQMLVCILVFNGKRFNLLWSHVDSSSLNLWLQVADSLHHFLHSVGQCDLNLKWVHGNSGFEVCVTNRVDQDNSWCLQCELGFGGFTLVVQNCLVHSVTVSKQNDFS